MKATAKLRKLHISPRKARLVGDLIRGIPALKALDMLAYTQKASAKPISILLKSAIANWHIKNPGQQEGSTLYIQTIHIDPAGMLKRTRPAPRGVAHRIRKRQSHITLTVAKRTEQQPSKQ